MSEAKENPSDIMLSFFFGLIGFVGVAGIMLTLVIGAYWYLYPMRCNFEAEGNFHPELSGYFSASSDGTSNMTSELLALNYSRNGSSFAAGQLAGSLDTSGRISGQVYCRDLSMALKAYAAYVECKNAQTLCAYQTVTSYTECIRAVCG
jgi:hypothetical protein